MRLLPATLCFWFLLFPYESLGQNLDTFLAEHKVNIQNFIMTGYGGGWPHCDVLSMNPLGGAPQFIMDFQTFNLLDISSALSSSHCLLATYHIESKVSLSAIIKFGWKVIQYKRIALILSMGNGVTLDMATDTEKLPFLIAAELECREKQFLCPIIGRRKPLLQGHMCDVSYASYRHKKLRVGIFGVQPHLFATKNGIDGTDIRLLNLLVEKLKFIPDAVIPRTYDQGANMVGKKYNHLTLGTKLIVLNISVCHQRNGHDVNEDIL